MREKLKNNEWDAIQNLTKNTHLDENFDVCEIDEETDGFYDFETEETVSLAEGLGWLFDGIAYPLQHDVTPDEAIVIADLLKEFGVIKEEDHKWLMQVQ